MNSDLRFFTDVSILHQIGRPLLVKFFARFTHLLPSKYSLPNPKPDNEAYFDSLAWTLDSRLGELPIPLIAAIASIDATAVRANAADPDPQNTQHTYLENAIEAWLAANPDPIQLSTCNLQPATTPAPAQLEPPVDVGTATQNSSEPGPAALNPSEPHPAGPIPHSALQTPHSDPPAQLATLNLQPSTSEDPTNPIIQQSSNPASPITPSLHHSTTPVSLHPDWLADVVPWPEPVDGAALLDTLAQTFARFIVLPQFGAEALALFTLHTYAFHLRDITAYIGVDSPTKRCGKSTLLMVLRHLANRPVLASNISSSALFRVIEQHRPIAAP